MDACKQLRIGRKTGYRWRAENGGLEPDYVPAASRSGRYLSLLERQRIASLRERGLTIREIAARLGRAPSTVSRELRRNSRPTTTESTMPTWPTTAAGNEPGVPVAPSMGTGQCVAGRRRSGGGPDRRRSDRIHHSHDPVAGSVRQRFARLDSWAR
ncbi:helix-turn-helix domain-containing protein [Streptomyces sp. V1I1]|uniref:helix-turn-helix domain-containing protein n=1 Tax=Streptomyces sp. V1I1 TaxID=3042272 RepID=UPI00358E4CF4